MSESASLRVLGWLGIARLGLVQTALGSIVVLTTSTLNRVMVVELALPAMVPGALVGWHYAVQLSRPRWGYGADRDGRRTPWILGGMFVLACSAVLASASTGWMASDPLYGFAAAALGFFGIGVGVGASGTNLLALLATQTAPARKAAAAAIVWIMMIAGFVLTASVAGAWLDPFSIGRLVAITAIVSAAAWLATLLALWGVEAPRTTPRGSAEPPRSPPFRAALAEVWQEPRARRFTVFVFVSMLAYSAQDLILEPFAGLVHGYTPGASTQLAGVQHGGVLLGMISTAVIATAVGHSRARFMRQWTIGGCVASALALGALAAGAVTGPEFPLGASVFALGVANGAFAVGAIGTMMAMAGDGHAGREGTRMGLWGAAQAAAFGIGGFLGAAAVDVTRSVLGDPSLSFAIVFAAEAAAFVVAARLASGIDHRGPDVGIPALPSAERIGVE